MDNQKVWHPGVMAEIREQFLEAGVEQEALEYCLGCW